MNSSPDNHLFRERKEKSVHYFRTCTVFDEIIYTSIEQRSGSVHAQSQRGEQGSDPTPLENHKNTCIGFLSNTGLDHLKNHNQASI